MKILFLTGGGDSGGAKTHLLNLLGKLNKEVECETVCFLEGDFYNEAKKRNISVVLMKQHVRFDVTVIFKLIKHINKGKFDIIHCHGSRANWWMFFVRPFVKAKDITTIHSDYRKDFISNKYKYIYFTILNTFAIRFFKYYIAVSNEFKKMLIDRKFKKEKIFTVYNGIDFDEKLDFSSREDFAKKYNLTDHLNKKWIGNISRLEQVKGVDIFIKGAKEMLNKRSDLLFLVAGSGDEEVRLKDLAKKLEIEDSIKFLGHINDVNSFLNSIDINTLTSRSESFTYVLLEGARFKKPTVSTNVGGIKYMILDNETGLMVESEDYKAFSKRLLTLLEDDDMAKNLGENLYNYVKENYSSESMKNTHLKIYKSILDSGEKREQ